MGAVCTVAAALFALALDWTLGADLILAMMVVLAGLEAALAFCTGCKIFALLMARGIIPADACPDCDDLARRHSRERVLAGK